MLGAPKAPYLKELNSELKNVTYDKAKKQYSFTADRQNINAVIISPIKPVSLTINEIVHTDLITTTKKGSVYIISLAPNANDMNGKEPDGRGEAHFSLSF
jgi:hypothetical protein